MSCELNPLPNLLSSICKITVIAVIDMLFLMEANIAVGWSSNWTFGCFGAACFAFLLAAYAYDSVVGDASAGQVNIVEGIVNLHVDTVRRDRLYIVEVKGIGFEVEKSVFLVFENREAYILYYTPRSKRIIAAEWLR